MATSRAVQIPGEQLPQADNTDGPATQPVVMAEKVAPVAGLRAIDVDPHKIRRAVLTVDGWVCPAVAPGFGGER